MRRPETPRPAITRDDITAHITRLADVLGVLRDADPDIYTQLGLRLTYQPGDQVVRADVSPAHHWFLESVRGGTDPVSPHCSISYNADIDLPQTDGT